MAITGLVCGGIALVGMIFAFALPASFTRGLMTGILGEEYIIGNMDELDDLMDDFGVVTLLLICSRMPMSIF